MRAGGWTLSLTLALGALPGAQGGVEPARARHGVVVSGARLASDVGRDALVEGGNAVDAAVATAFALAVTLPSAGNIGGGGFLVYRSARGEAVAYDFRERAPAAAHPEMFFVAGAYDEDRHHEGGLSIGVPGSVAGLHLAWSDHGRLSWERLVRPAIALARDGFVVSDELARSLAELLPTLRERGYQATLAQFSDDGRPYEMGETLRQPELASTLERIAAQGPAGFYAGPTADLLVAEMERRGGLITHDDLKSYRALRRDPVRGSYRGYGVLGMPPPSSGGTVLIEMLNVLEGYDLGGMGPGSAAFVHHVAETMRRAFADRARFLGDPSFVADMPLARLLSKQHALSLRATIREDRASVSSPETFEWPAESEETTHLSVIDAERNAVALTTTLEDSYGAKLVVPGAGFLLNDEMGDFNAGPGLTTAQGLIGTPPNLARPGQRMLSSMTPTILEKDGQPFLVVGSPGGRTIINTALLTILNVVDFGMNVQQAIDAPRFHHQWLPDQLRHERFGLSPDTRALLERRGHALEEVASQGRAHAVVYDAEHDTLQAGVDRRDPDAFASGY